MLKLFLFLFSLSKGLDFVFLLEISVSNFMNRFLFVMHHCLQNAKGDTAHRRFHNTTRSHRRQWIKSVNAKSNIAAIVRLWDNINVNDLDCEDHLGLKKMGKGSTDQRTLMSRISLAWVIVRNSNTTSNRSYQTRYSMFCSFDNFVGQQDY